MNIIDKYPSLSYFLRCYFNQDFEVLFGSADGALDAYISTENEDERLCLREEINNLLALSLDDSELEDIILNKIDCSYYYPNEWRTAKDWSEHICKKID
ncbi:contact-dependent growth inhibition system immunity protein [Dickeya zeae]|uniref:contact-dependent growth inhibition system immunity protein n=1 Tax=Dickeya zeae TaxID=204042 RepID=UPI0020C0CB0A|nr:contact-dependent growth inhibition system immunity protein [Dickeya zeae]